MPSVVPMATTDLGPAPLRAVLFDMDGTLVETEQLWGEAMFELAASLGGRMSDEARAATVGTSMRVAMEILYADIGVVRSEVELWADAARVEDRTAELMADGVEWRPGAPELLRDVRAAGLATALVTTTPRALADLVLGSIRAGLGFDPFDLTVCGDEVVARKPDPAPYLQAMARAGRRAGGVRRHRGLRGRHRLRPRCRRRRARRPHDAGRGARSRSGAARRARGNPAERSC